MTVNTPEHAAASLEVQIMDAMQPLRDAADRLEAGAQELRAAARRGDTDRAMAIGTDLLAEHVRFAQMFRLWLGARPDAPHWRSLVVEAQAPSRLPPGSDQIDRSST